MKTFITAQQTHTHTHTHTEKWNHIGNAVDAFGKIQTGSNLETAITAKKNVLINYKRDPSGKSFAALRKARNDVQRTARRCENDYWLNICKSIQLDLLTAATTVPCINKTSPRSRL